MDDALKLRYLRVALLAVGVIFIVSVYPLSIVWPSGWAWHEGRSEYLEMIIAIYATLGVFLMIASKNPLQHRSLISFTIWSSVVHGAVMAAQSLQNPQHHVGHLYGDVPALFIVAGVLWALLPRSAPAQARA